MSYIFVGRKNVQRGGLGALGYSDPRGACASGRVSGGQKRCFRAREESTATRLGCVRMTTRCTVGSDQGTDYCCPAGAGVTSGRTRTTTAGTTRTATAGAAAPSGGKTLIQMATELVTGERTEETAPSSEGFSKYAQNVATTSAAATEDEILPVEEVPQAATGLQRYMPHITIASTLIGVAVFLGWVILRK